MELKRLLRIARARRWLFVVLAGGGLVLGGVLTTLYNSRIEPEWEANAPVLFSYENDDDRQSGLQNLVAAAMDLAEDANSENLGPLAMIQIDTEDRGIIQFIGLGRNESNAQATALLLRNTYVTAARAQLQGTQSDRQGGIARLDTALAAIQAEMSELNQQLAADPALVERVDELENDRNALASLLDQLEIELLLGSNTTATEEEPRTVEDVEDEIEIVRGAIEDIELELDEIDVPSSNTLSEISRRLEVLDDQYRSLLNDYTTILLQEERTEPFTLGLTETIDSTPTPASVVLGSIFGLLIGTALAVGIVVVADRTRLTVWVANDLNTMPVLAELSARNPLRVAGQSWYELGGPSQRRRAVRGMRVTVERRLAGARTALGFTGLNTPAVSVHEVAADFAMSMVTSGNRVLLVDADLDHPSELAEFDGPGATFSDILAHSMDDEESFRSFVKRAVTETKEIRPGLIAMRVGGGLRDPADALASRRMEIMLAEVFELFDMVIVATGDARERMTQTVLKRLDHVILAIRPGRTTAPAVEALHAQFNSSGIAVIGAALVMRAAKKDDVVKPALQDTEPPYARRQSERSPVEGVGVEAVQRRYEKDSRSQVQGPDPFEEATPAAVTPAKAAAPQVDALPAPPPVESEEDLEAAAITPLDLELAPAPRVDALPAPRVESEEDLEAAAITPLDLEVAPVLATIGASSPAANGDLRERLASLMDATIQQVMHGFRGSASTQRIDPGIRDVTKYGFVPLVRVKGQKTVGTRVLDSLAEDLGDEAWRRLQNELMEFFGIEPGGRANDRVATAINQWTAKHFFTRHLAETGREPEIWHVSSPAGTFQALTHYKRATKERIDVLRSEILRRQLDTLNRHLKSAVKNKKSSQVRRFEEQIKDVRTFDIALGWLYEGTTPNARIWYPWKNPEQQPQGWDPNFDEGIRANVAPLQRLGLLVQDVLTDEELLALSPRA